ncbi:ABC-2 type transport system permease protein [Conyzicola nivalis]|uniref:Transport permease protein n=1 Tax=Conyzicola nivalis TaxID=1477021 RepID=A0ABV2QR25_9MICO
MDQRDPGSSPTLRVIDEPLREIGGRGSRSTWSSITEIVQHRQLLGRLVNREIRARYKNSTLGVVWSLMRPLAQLVIYYVAIGQFLGAARNVPDFAIFVFTGLTIWSLFSEIVSSGTGSILANAGLIKKVYLPREIFPLAAVGGALFNFVVQFLVLVVATIVLGRLPLSPNLLYLPLAIVLMVVLGTAIALVLSAVNVYLRDVEHLIDIFLMVFFWASPIVYSVTFVNEALQGSWIEQVYLANPVTLAVLGMQKAMWVAGVNDPSQFWPDDLGLRMLIALGVSLVALFLAQRVFSRLQGNFAQEL